jgi:hypothetical protein
MWAQMKLNPAPPDPTQAMIFNWMPVIFTFMLRSACSCRCPCTGASPAVMLFFLRIGDSPPGRRRWAVPGFRCAQPTLPTAVELAGISRYIVAMSPAVKSMLERVASWPAEDQEELSEFAREIEARRTGVYRLSEEERAAIDSARRGPLVADEEVEAFWKRRGLA